MTRALQRTNFNRSRLTRFLSDRALVDAAEAGQPFAERLGLGLDFTDAIALSAAHRACAAIPPTAAAVASPGVEEAFARVRSTLTHSITQSCSPNGGGTRIKLPAPQPGVAIEIAADYEPYRRFYLAHQRDMESGVRPLRGQLREALARASPALRKLAVLDAALDGILSARESKALATLPALLEKRFEQLLKAHQQSLLDTRQADDPALWRQAEGWLAVFCKEMQGLLLAELDLRLQPAMGLIEAFSNEAINLK